MQSDLKNQLKTAAQQVEATLGALLPQSGGQNALAEVEAAMRYATLNGGKRLRAFLVLEGARICGADPAQALRAAAAIECIHAYSLVHDDMPCMDDDDLRRGMPTVHIKWDESTAVLVGDALQSIAFELLAAPETHAEPLVRLELVQTLARASGVLGMVGGQALDIGAETAKSPLSLTQILELQALKTGALIEWSAQAGAMLGQAEPQMRAALATYAQRIGVAFQIQDDVLDIEGDEAATGKRLQKDTEAGKATFITHLGLEGAKTRAQTLVSEAKSALDPIGPAGNTLRALADYIITRNA